MLYRFLLVKEAYDALVQKRSDDDSKFDEAEIKR